MFKNGSEYEYANVEQGDFDRLRGAPSVGSHFNSTFRAKYSATLVTQPRAKPAVDPALRGKPDRDRRQPPAGTPTLPKAIADAGRRAGQPKAPPSDVVKRVEERRGRELALIEAARKWRKIGAGSTAQEGNDALKALEAAVDAFEAGVAK